MQEVKLFENVELSAKIRTLTIDGQIYFVGKEIAEALGYKKPQNAIKEHVDQEDKKVFTKKDLQKMALNQDSPVLGTFFAERHFGGTQRLTFINESGLYSLIFSSELPQAKAFKRWVTSEVLPSIRKNGYYGSQQFMIDKVCSALADGYELGYSDAIKENMKAYKEGFKAGYNQGFDESYKNGFKKGYAIAINK